MLETFTFRMSEAAALEALGPNVGESRGIARVVEITADDPLFEQLRKVDLAWREQHRSFLLGWDIQRSYSDAELAAAKLFRLTVVPVFEPAGAECGTQYNDSKGCECGHGREQVSPLRIDGKRIPAAKDLAETIAGEEWIVSQRLADFLKRDELTGLELRAVERCKRPGDALEGWHQLVLPGDGVMISPKTRAGISPFDSDELGEYRCPRGHVIGLNLLSEVVVDADGLQDRDFSLTYQSVGVKRGLLIPRRQILISPRALKVLQSSKARGWRVEVAHVM